MPDDTAWNTDLADYADPHLWPDDDDRTREAVDAELSQSSIGQSSDNALGADVKAQVRG